MGSFVLTAQWSLTHDIDIDEQVQLLSSEATIHDSDSDGVAYNNVKTLAAAPTAAQRGLPFGRARHPNHDQSNLDFDRHAAKARLPSKGAFNIKKPKHRKAPYAGAKRTSSASGSATVPSAPPVRPDPILSNITVHVLATEVDENGVKTFIETNQVFDVDVADVWTFGHLTEKIHRRLSNNSFPLAAMAFERNHFWFYYKDKVDGTGSKRLSGPGRPKDRFNNIHDDLPVKFLELLKAHANTGRTIFVDVQVLDTEDFEEEGAIAYDCDADNDVVRDCHHEAQQVAHDRDVTDVDAEIHDGESGEGGSQRSPEA